MTAGTHKLSFFAALFININIMLGTGVFINTVQLAQKVGSLGPLLYAVAGLLMLPLALSLAQLMQECEGGSFFQFGSLLSPYWGFISTWSYFVGKLATPTLGIHVFAIFLQKTFSPCATVPLLWLDAALITFFVLLNILSGALGKRIQYLFLLTKSIPLFFAIGMGLWCFDIVNIPAASALWEGVPLSIPLVIFCFLGFEATCSLSRVIENPQKNGSRAIIYSFLIVMSLLMLYQFLFFGSLGSALAAQDSAFSAFGLLLKNHLAQGYALLNPLISLAIATSALGGAYGLLYSNAWNLHTLASKELIPFSNYWTSLNAHHVPYLAVLAEGALCLIYLGLTKGSQIPLQYTSVLSCMVTYGVSIFALHRKSPSWISISGLLSCFLAIFFCVRGFIFTNILPFIFLLGILLLGTTLYLRTKKRSRTQ